jgi:hypothetical protein
MSNEQPRQFTYPKVYAKAYALKDSLSVTQRYPLGLAPRRPLGHIEYARETRAFPRVNCSMLNDHCSLIKFHRL